MPTGSNLGKWEPWYGGLKKGDPRPGTYGTTPVYKLGAEWLADCDPVEDWGCGYGHFSLEMRPGQVIGIDGTASPFCDVVDDLAARRVSVPGIFMRHVLEHNWRWADILRNAVASFTRRMCLSVFTPPSKVTMQVGYTAELGVPDIAFRHEDLTALFGDEVTWIKVRVESRTAYGAEWVFFMEKVT